MIDDETAGDDTRTVNMPDPVVRRVNDMVTTALDTLGTLLLAAALGWWAWQEVALGAGLAAAGVTLGLLSGWAQRRNSPRPVKVPKGAHPHLRPLPGPEHPGNVHVKGR